MTAPAIGGAPESLFHAEHDALERHTMVPLIYLPVSYATGGRVRDLRLNADGTPDVADASLADASRGSGP
jgi:hypothetical protein